DAFAPRAGHRSGSRGAHVERPHPALLGVRRRIEGAPDDVCEAGRLEPGGERLEVVGVAVRRAELRDLLAEVEVDLVEPGLDPRRTPWLAAAPVEVLAVPVHVRDQRPL